MSIRFSADSIGAPLTQDISTINNSTAISSYHRHQHHQVQEGEMSVVSTSINSSSSKMETQSLMDTTTNQGRPYGTPDAVDQASHMSSDFKNSNNQHQPPPPQQQQQNMEVFGESVNVQDMFTQLSECLALEPKYQPSLFLPLQSNDGEITIGTRDGAAHVLRCLKVWYDLPNDVLFTAINLVDRFLTKMKVKPKHMACISVGSFHLAVKQFGLLSIDTEDLVAISQCRCTARDLERMAEIIEGKLGVQMNTPAVTGLTFIRLFYHIFREAAKELDLSAFYEQAIQLSDLEQRMEILACDASCSSIRPSELALVMLCTAMDASVSKNNAGQHQISGLVDYAIQMQKMCRIPDSTFFHTHSTVVKILSNYNGSQKMPYRQRLVWKLSSRTLRHLRPTDKLKVSSYLPTIEEDASNNNLRFRTGSVSSEDGSEDWPTSPVVAVCEQC